METIAQEDPVAVLKAACIASFATWAFDSATSTASWSGRAVTPRLARCVMIPINMSLSMRIS